MKRALLAAVLLALALAPLAKPARAAGDGFHAVVSQIESRFRIRGTHVPLMGFASFFGSVLTRGGVKGMQVTEFDDVGPSLTPDALRRALREGLGPPWHLFVEGREIASGDTTYVYSRVTDGTMRLLVADLDGGELDLVEMRLNGRRLAAWLQDPEGSLASRKRIP